MGYTGSSMDAVQDNLTGDLSGVTDPVGDGIVDADGQVTEVNGATVPAVNQGAGASQDGLSDIICADCPAPVSFPSGVEVDISESGADAAFSGLSNGSTGSYV